MLSPLLRFLLGSLLVVVIFLTVADLHCSFGKLCFILYSSKCYSYAMSMFMDTSVSATVPHSVFENVLYVTVSLSTNINFVSVY